MTEEKRELTGEIVRLDDKKIVTKQVEHRDGLTFMRIKSRRLK